MRKSGIFSPLRPPPNYSLISHDQPPTKHAVLHNAERPIFRRDSGHFASLAVVRFFFLLLFFLHFRLLSHIKKASSLSPSKDGHKRQCADAATAIQRYREGRVLRWREKLATRSLTISGERKLSALWTIHYGSLPVL